MPRPDPDLTCAICGDRHEDVGIIDGEPRCFLCQPCPGCGETGGDCDPYGGPAGNSGYCHRTGRYV